MTAPRKKSPAKKAAPRIKSASQKTPQPTPGEHLAALPTAEGQLKSLPDCRKQIDATDDQIIILLEKRARIARRVGELKAEEGADYFDAGRHLQLLNSISKRGGGDFPREGLRLVFGEILSACLNLQAPQTIAFLGPEATFTHIAASRAFGRSARFVPYDGISEIFLAVEKGWAHFGVVPIENSTGGVIHTTLDELINYRLQICAEVYIPIRHNLLCRGPQRKIQRICTHPQILSQCRIWIKENLPGVELIETASSADGAKRAQKSKTTATIGPRLASDIYNLPLLEEGIEDKKDNVTRFLILGRQTPRPSGQDKTSVMFSIKDEPGTLYDLLKPFANRGINLTKIESRPTRQRAWDYIFFTDIEGHISDPEINAAVEELRAHCTFLRVLGSYPVDREADSSQGG